MDHTHTLLWQRDSMHIEALTLSLCLAWGFFWDSLDSEKKSRYIMQLKGLWQTDVFSGTRTPPCSTELYLRDRLLNRPHTSNIMQTRGMRHCMYFSLQKDAIKRFYKSKWNNSRPVHIVYLGCIHAKYAYCTATYEKAVCQMKIGCLKMQFTIQYSMTCRPHGILKCPTTFSQSFFFSSSVTWDRDFTVAFWVA